MDSNNELDFQVNDLKNKISSLFNKFKTLQSSMNLIMDIVSSNPEYNLTKNKIELLATLSKDLNSENQIDNFFQIKSLAFEVEKMIFDLEHIIQVEIPEFIIPEITTAILEDNSSTLIGNLKNIIDPQFRITHIKYKLYKETLSNSIEVTSITPSELTYTIDFNFRENGKFFFVANYFYENDNKVIQNKSIRSNTVEIQIIEREIPTVCCAALTSFENKPKGFLTKVIDKDSSITEVIYNLKNINNLLIESVTSTNAFTHIEFKEVNSGTYFFDCICKYNTGSKTDQILLKSNVITIENGATDPVLPTEKWPRGIFAPFVDAARDDVNLKFPIADKSKVSGVQFYNLGFITADSNKNPAWAGNINLPGDKGTNAGLMQDIERLRSMGGDVCISFGGLNGPYLNEVITDIADLKNKYKAIINTWNLKRVDFDMEHNRTVNGETCEENKRNHLAIELLQRELKAEGKNVGIWFTLPVMPYGLNQNELLLLDDAIKKNVEIEGVNVMAMCYGSAYSGNMGEQAISAMVNLHLQLKNLYENNNIIKTDDELWAMIGICPEIGINDTGAVNTFFLEDVQIVLEFCKSKNVGMISFWSANRDKQNNGSEPNGPDSTGLIQQELAFTNAFQIYNNINDNVNTLNTEADCGFHKGIQTWHESMSYPVSNTKVYYNGKYYVNGWYVSAWSNPPSSNEAWKEITI